MAELISAQGNRARAQAVNRVRSSAGLARYADTLITDDPVGEGFWQWVANAPERELIRWAEDQRVDRLEDSDVAAAVDVVSDREEDWQ